MKEVERICRESNCYDAERVKNFLKVSFFLLLLYSYTSRVHPHYSSQNKEAKCHITMSMINSSSNFQREMHKFFIGNNYYKLSNKTGWNV